MYEINTIRVILRTCSVSNEDNKRFILLTKIAQLFDFISLLLGIWFCAWLRWPSLSRPLSRTKLIIINMIHRGKIIVVNWLTRTCISAAENEFNHYCVGCHIIIIKLEHRHCNRSRWHNNCFTSTRHDVRVGSRYRFTDNIIGYNINQFNSQPNSFTKYWVQGWLDLNF